MVWQVTDALLKLITDRCIRQSLAVGLFANLLVALDFRYEPECVLRFCSIIGPMTMGFAVTGTRDGA